MKFANEEAKKKTKLISELHRKGILTLEKHPTYKVNFFYSFIFLAFEVLNGSASKISHKYVQ